MKNLGKIQKSITEHVRLSKLLDACEKSAASFEPFFEKLAVVSPDFEELVGKHENYFKAANDLRSSNFENVFDSSHMKYIDVALEQFDLVANYPGPIYVCGMGLGATIALAVSALRSDLVKRCIAMSPLLELHEFLPDAKIPFINSIGPLDLSSPMSWYPNSSFPVASLSAAARFSRIVCNSSKFKRIFRSGRVTALFVLTEDDDSADIISSNDYYYECGGDKSGHNCFVYPRTLKVPHSILDPTIPMKGMMNRYYYSLYQNCFTYLETGYIDPESMLFSSSDTSLPVPPTAKQGRSDYYTKAYRSSSNSKFRA